jgi:hypothetical protein
MTTLKVRAHWTGQPPSVPIPSPIGIFGTPPIMSSSPIWPSSPAGPVKTNQLYNVWCPLVPQSALDDPLTKWGTNTVPPKPPSWASASGAAPNTYDEGYGNSATDFRVTALRLWQEGKPGNDFTYTVTTPSGLVVGTITPAAPGWTTIALSAPIASGKGIWRIDIDRAPISSVSAPSLLLGTPIAGGGVDEPYVAPYGNQFEGILGLEFTGDEIVVTPPSCPGVTINPISISPNCINGKWGVDFTIQVSQPATQTSVFQWNYGDGTTGSPSLGQAFVAIGSSATVPVPADHHDYLPGTYTATLKVISPSPCPDRTVRVVVQPCVCPTQIQSIQIVEGACDAQGNRVITAIALPVPGFVVGTYSWAWDNGIAAPGGQTSPPMTFSNGSSHSVQLAVTTGGCTQLLSAPFNVSVCATTPTPTTATPTTPTPTTTPTSTTPTPTTPTPTTPTSTTPTPTTPTPTAPPTTLGCAISLALAMLLLGLAAIGLALSGVMGPAGVGLIVPSLAFAASGLIVLGLWMIFCRNCPVIRFLQRFFGVMALLLTAMAALFTLIGLIGPGIGAAAVATLFGVMVGMLSLGAGLLKCP